MFLSNPLGLTRLYVVNMKSSHNIYDGGGHWILSFFSSVFSVIWILMCGIAVSFSPAVCGFSSFWTTVFGKEDPSRYCGIAVLGTPPPPPKFPSLCLLCLLLVIGTWQNGVQFTMVIYSCLSKIPQLRSCVLSFYHNCNRRLGRKGNNPKANKKNKHCSRALVWRKYRYRLEESTKFATDV